MHISLNTTRTIALVAAALGLFCACGLGPPTYHPPPPDLVTVSADTLRFEAAIGGASNPQHFSIANASSQNTTISLQSARVGSQKNSPFTFQTDCGSSLAANSSCTVTVTFRPTSSESTSGRIWLHFQNHELHMVTLQGKIIAPSK